MKLSKYEKETIKEFCREISGMLLSKQLNKRRK